MLISDILVKVNYAHSDCIVQIQKCKPMTKNMIITLRYCFQSLQLLGQCQEPPKHSRPHYAFCAEKGFMIKRAQGQGASSVQVRPQEPTEWFRKTYLHV